MILSHLWAWLPLAVGSGSLPSWIPLLPILGMVLIVGSLLVMVRRRRQRVPGPTRQELTDRTRQVQGVHHDLEHIMVEIEQMAKRLSAQLDAKATRLEQLLAQADQKIQQLSAPPLVTPRDDLSLSTQLAADAFGALPQSPPEDPLARSVCALADEGLTSEQIAQRLGEHLGKVELILALRSVR